MKRLEIKPSIFILIDDDDYEEVTKRSWYINRATKHVMSSSYTKPRHIRLTNFLVPHNTREAYVIHKNNNLLDFQKDNLEAVPLGRFNASRSLLKSNKSGFRGVCWAKEKDRWQAQLTFMGVNYQLGRYRDIKDAALAYNSKALDVYGEAAVLNDVDSFEGKLNIDKHRFGITRKIYHRYNHHNVRVKKFATELIK